MANTDPEAVRFLKIEKTNPLEDLKINSELATQTVVSYFVQLNVVQRGLAAPLKVINANGIIINATLGCFDETVLTLKVMTGSSPNIVNSNFVAMDFVFPVVSASTTTVLQLSNLILFESDIAGCGPYKITSATDQTITLLTTSSSPITLTSNPTIRDLTTGAFNPELTFTNYPGFTSNKIYLKAETFGRGSVKATAVFTFGFSLCDDQPTVLIPKYTSSMFTGSASEAVDIQKVLKLLVKYPQVCSGFVYSID